jgi:hypothetical protein
MVLVGPGSANGQVSLAASADAARSVRSSGVKYTERLSCIRSLPWLPGLNTPSVFIILLLID